jgi:hypothetical protein
MDEEVLRDDEIERAVRTIFKLAQTDVAFRALCLSDPGEAIRQITGKSLPPGRTIRFVEPEPGGAAKAPPEG